MHLPRVKALLPRVADPLEANCCVVPRVANSPQENCHVVEEAPNPSPSRPVAQAPATRSQSQPPCLSPTGRPNYISQNENNDPPTLRRITSSTSNSIMQEAILTCVNIYKPRYDLSANLGILNFAAPPKLTGTTYTVTPQQMLARRIPMNWFCKMANSVIGAKSNGELLEYRHLIAHLTTRTTWMHSYGNEIGQLAQGMPGQNTGTNTIIFTKKNQVPKDRAKDVTYGLITCLVRPEKMDEPNRTRLVAGGNRVHYPGDAGTPTANLLTVKLLLNSIISTPNAKFMTMDIKDFYLNTPMARFEYMRLQLEDMPEDVIAHYNLNKIATPEGYIYCEIQKGMYGLPQAGIIAQQLLKERLQMDGYRQSKTTPGLWQHDTRLIIFSFIVDDFGVKYMGKENAQHLLDTIQKHYKCSCNWKGEQYCGLTIKWDYEGRKVHLFIPGYLQKALSRFQHSPPVKQQDQPYPHIKPNYGAKKQYSQEDDDSPALNKARKKITQEVWGVFLFLARVVDWGLLLLSALSRPNRQTRQRKQWDFARNF